MKQKWCALPTFEKENIQFRILTHCITLGCITAASVCMTMAPSPWPRCSPVDPQRLNDRTSPLNLGQRHLEGPWDASAQMVNFTCTFYRFLRHKSLLTRTIDDPSSLSHCFSVLSHSPPALAPFQGLVPHALIFLYFHKKVVLGRSSRRRKNPSVKEGNIQDWQKTRMVVPKNHSCRFNTISFNTWMNGLPEQRQSSPSWGTNQLYSPGWFGGGSKKDLNCSSRLEPIHTERAAWKIQLKQHSVRQHYEFFESLLFSAVSFSTCPRTFPRSGPACAHFFILP